MEDPSFSHDVLVDGVQPGNQFILALVSGLATAIVCALLWPVIASYTGPDIDLLALAVGAAIGLAVRFSGKGTSPLYGIIALILTLISTGVGDILGVIVSGTSDHFDIFGIAQKVNLPDVIMSILTKATPATFLMFGTGMALAFLVAIRR